MSYLTFCSLCLVTLRSGMGKHMIHATLADVVEVIKVRRPLVPRDVVGR